MHYIHEIECNQLTSVSVNKVRNASSSYLAMVRLQSKYCLISSYITLTFIVILSTMTKRNTLQNWAKQKKRETKLGDHFSSVVFEFEVQLIKYNNSNYLNIINYLLKLTFFALKKLYILRVNY